MLRTLTQMMYFTTSGRTVNNVTLYLELGIISLIIKSNQTKKMISLPMIKETAEQRYTRLFEEMYEICNTEGWGDPFSYARSREIHMAGILGHGVADDYSGADAYDKYDLPVEYKSTIGKKLTATYNGISVQPYVGKAS